MNKIYALSVKFLGKMNGTSTYLMTAYKYRAYQASTNIKKSCAKKKSGKKTVYQASLKFFNEYPIKDWSFDDYYQSKYHNLNKEKKFASIKLSFKNDLDWIMQLDNTPSEVVDHAKSLSLNPTPSSSEMKVKLLNEANKRSKASYTQKIRSKGSGSISIGNVANGKNINVECSRKRKVVNEFGENDSTNTGTDLNAGVAETDNVEQNTNDNSRLWKKWMKFLEKEKHNFHPYSPAAHNIIRCGKGISSRPFLDETSNNDHLSTHLVNEFPIPIVSTISIES